MDGLFPNSLSGLTPDLDKSLIIPSAYSEKNSFSQVDIVNSPFSDEHLGEDFENIFTTKKENHPLESVQAVDVPLKSGDSHPKKRLNDMDGNILVDHFSCADSKTGLEKFFSRFLPIIYKKKIVAEALSELTSLSKIANELITKQIPYGEQDATYEDLIAYLSSASSIHAKLKRRI